MDDREVKIIMALADNKMNITQAAKSLFMHRNTVEYNIGKIRKKTGLDPTDFHDLCKLVEMVAKNEIGSGCNG